MHAAKLPLDLQPGVRTIAGGWAVVALAYAPAVWMIGAAQGQGSSPIATIGAMVLFFLPWALATPPLLRLSARRPLGIGRTQRSLMLLAMVGLVAIPTITAIGLALEWTLSWVAGARHAMALSRLAAGVAITSFFSVPVYGAVIGVGQTLIWVERTRQRERMLARARLDTLRAQIKPHFLFNALSAISELAHRDAATAQLAISRLADVLRTTLASDMAAATLAEEVALTKDHIELHRLLLPGPLDVRLTISPEAWVAQVPALILQPLVENAFVHALSRLTGGAWLTITADVCDGHLAIEVTNAITSTDAPSRGLGSGVASVRERVAAWSGGGGELTTDQRPDRFVAQINLPLMPVEAAP
jgi:hypothetical protein